MNQQMDDATEELEATGSGTAMAEAFANATRSKPKNRRTDREWLATYFAGTNRMTCRTELARALDGGTLYGHRLTACERIFAEYAVEQADRLAAMNSVVVEYADTENRVRRLADDFRTFRDPTHLDQALESLERKLELLERKRREVLGVY